MSYWQRRCRAIDIPGAAAAVGSLDVLARKAEVVIVVKVVEVVVLALHRAGDKDGCWQILHHYCKNWASGR